MSEQMSYTGQVSNLGAEESVQKTNEEVENEMTTATYETPSNIAKCLAMPKSTLTSGKPSPFTLRTIKECFRTWEM